MNTRPTPTINLVLEMLGRDEKLLKKTYRGLNEVSLSRIYPNLSLDEAIAFAAISWGDRWRDINQYASQVDEIGLYAVFNSAMGRGMAALNAAKNIHEKHKGLYERLNPFEGNLRERLERVLEQDEARLREVLKQPTKFYASEGQYQSGHARSNADKEGKQLLVMSFLPVYLKNSSPETIKKGYATEIAGMLRNYPRVFEPIKTTAEPVKVNKPEQLPLL